MVYIILYSEIEFRHGGRDMEISALDESGKPVDWWFAYKVPKLAEVNAAGPTGTVTSAIGYEYVYYDPKVAKIDMSKFLLSEDNGAVDLTLNSILKKPDSTTGWILYNDEMPASADRKDNGNLGHTKGVLAFDTTTKTALWLLH
jgi:deoxyribonuclease-2